MLFKESVLWALKQRAKRIAGAQETNSITKMNKIGIRRESVKLKSLSCSCSQFMNWFYVNTLHMFPSFKNSMEASISVPIFKT